jgi:hypothetical protein
MCADGGGALQANVVQSFAPRTAPGEPPAAKRPRNSHGPSAPPQPLHQLLPPLPALDAVVGMDDAKSTLMQASLLPLVLPPHVLTGARKPPSAVLLYGPPGEGAAWVLLA